MPTHRNIDNYIVYWEGGYCSCTLNTSRGSDDNINIMICIKSLEQHWLLLRKNSVINKLILIKSHKEILKTKTFKKAEQSLSPKNNRLIHRQVVFSLFY